MNNITNEDKTLGHLRNKCNPRTAKKGRPANALKSKQDTAYSSLEATAAHLDESIFSMDNSKNMYGFGALVSPILPFARTNQMELKYKANLVGEKIINPTIHFCELCDLPILIYGRMIPCKHVFCFNCANKSDKSCLRCSEEIFKIEKCNLGTVYMCRTDSCKRTYLSQRDLEAHIKHRHVRKSDLPQRL